MIFPAENAKKDLRTVVGLTNLVKMTVRMRPGVERTTSGSVFSKPRIVTFERVRCLVLDMPVTDESVSMIGAFESGAPIRQIFIGSLREWR